MVHRSFVSTPRLTLVRPIEEAELVARCQDGEPEALRKLFERERMRVHRLLFRVVGSNTHMDDLLQDTFLEVFRSLSSFRGESSIRTWIDRCAVRVAYAHFRRKARLRLQEPIEESLRSDAPGPEENTSRREAVRRLYAELARLEVKQRLAFTLCTVEGRSLAEVAEIMETTVATAKIRVWRARRTLESRAHKDPLLSEFLHETSEPEEEEVVVP
jgi:RNA polymerase sigma-70 factor, ECF subfamily